MQINIMLDGGEGPHELNALAALIASLGGRAAAPNAQTTSTSPSGPAVQPTPIVLTPPAPDQEADETEVDPAVVAGAPAYDSAGLPWDERVHASSRATLQDGTWRRRKNTDDALFESVMAELRAAHPTQADVPPPPPATTSDTLEPPAPEPVVTAPVEAAATTAADVPAPPAGDGPDMSTWPKFVQAVQAKPVAETSKTYDALNELSATFGAAKFLEMKDKAAQWPMFYDMVG